MVWFVTTIGFLTLFAGKSAAQSSYFPLAVGNQWLYECTNVIYEPTYFHDEPICLVSVDSTGHRSGDTDLQELAIVDTMRISPDSPQKGVWITGPWPEEPNGTLYYLLEGEILKKIGLRPSLNIQRQWYDALLIREIRTREEMYEKEEGVLDFGYFDDGIENLIVVGGVRNGIDGQWLLFNKDVPFWHLSPGGFGTFFWNMGIEVSEEVQIWYSFSNFGYNHDPIQVPAGLYTSVSCCEVEIGGFYSSGDISYETIPQHLTRLCFAEETGIVQIGRDGQGLDLISFVRGSNHETAVETVNWGYLKNEIWKNEKRH